MLFMAGISFICVGLFAVFSPQTIAGLIDMDVEQVKIIGYALSFAGVSDFVIAKIFQSKS